MITASKKGEIFWWWENDLRFRGNLLETLTILIEISNYNTNYTVGALMDGKHAIVLIPLSFLWIFAGYTQAVLFTSILGKSANVFDPLNIYAVYDSWCDIQ